MEKNKQSNFERSNENNLKGGINNANNFDQVIEEQAVSEAAYQHVLDNAPKTPIIVTTSSKELHDAIMDIVDKADVNVD